MPYELRKAAIFMSTIREKASAGPLRAISDASMAALGPLRFWRAGHQEPPPITDELATAITRIPAREVGSKARLYYRSVGPCGHHNYPPWRIAYVPVLREILVVIIAAALTARAGPGVRAATGLSLLRQFADMLNLWFAGRIDPPSYYQQEFWRPRQRRLAGQYLTRVETKNGLLGAINRQRKSPYPVNELNQKRLFYDCCRMFGLPHPPVLAVVSTAGVERLGKVADFNYDLFCKPQKGCGAVGTLSFRYLTSEIWQGSDGVVLGFADLLHEIASACGKHPMLVQPRLRNHAEIADFAVESLVTFRVVTCRGDGGEPEVTLAMLRVLAKLEPTWPNATDEEFAAPIDLSTGRLGLFTGDNMTTSPYRYDTHPLTGAKILDREVQHWPAIKSLAIRAHQCFRYRSIIGWDIALTPAGPVLLEGNNNLDVMFLQRVHDRPAGQTQFGEFISQQIEKLVVARQK